MKIGQMIACMLLPAMLAAQEGAYSIKGKITDLDTPSIAYLAYKKEGRNTRDSGFIHKGEFELKGTTDQPFFAWLVIDRKGVGLNNLGRRGANDVLALYVEKGTIVLTGKDSVRTAAMSGSPLNKDYQQLAAAFCRAIIRSKIGTAEYHEIVDASRYVPELPDF